MHYAGNRDFKALAQIGPQGLFVKEETGGPHSHGKWPVFRFRAEVGVGVVISQGYSLRKSG